MSFHFGIDTSRYLVALSVGYSSFPLFSPAVFSLDHSGCCKMFPHNMSEKRLSGVHVPTSNVVSVSRNTNSFDLITMHEIRNILLRYISVASSFFSKFLKLSKHRIHSQYIRIGSLKLSRTLIVMWTEMHLFVRTDFILWKIIFGCAILDEISVLFLPSLDIKVPYPNT